MPRCTVHIRRGKLNAKPCIKETFPSEVGERVVLVKSSLKNDPLYALLYGGLCTLCLEGNLAQIEKPPTTSLLVSTVLSFT